MATAAAPSPDSLPAGFRAGRVAIRLTALAVFVAAILVRQYGGRAEWRPLSLDGAIGLIYALLAATALTYFRLRWLTSRTFQAGAACMAGVALLAGAVYLLSRSGLVGPKGQAAVGILCFLGLAAGFSRDLARVNWRTIAGGFLLQVTLALLILRLEIPWNGTTVRPIYELFRALGEVVTQFLAFSDRGAEFVFGPLANRGAAMERSFGPADSFVFAFRALPTVIFISAFFTVLYYIGLLPFIVKWMARGMMRLMRTSGAESLSSAANVFMGQTEAPLIVKPYIPRMTESELLALMVGGMATIAGSVMAVYIGMGADAVAILTTSVMAAPCSLYLAKLALPETETPETLGRAQPQQEATHRNLIDAFSSGASDGVRLAINIAAMLIAFIALIALIDAVLGLLHDGLSLRLLFARLFAPVAFLMGVEPADAAQVGSLLGTKLAANEFVAYADMTRDFAVRTPEGITVQGISPRSYQLATFALTGFANFSSVGIQLGGIGALAPERRADLARLGTRALFVGFTATLINAAIAGVLI